MSRRVLMPNAGTIDRRASRMAPGGRVRAESRIIPHYPMIGDVGEEPAVVEPLPQFWWKFDEASGLFHDSVSDAATMTGGIYASYRRTPLAPDSTYSMGTAAFVEIDYPAVPAPPITPGPTGWIVFDWWAKDWDNIVLDGRQIDVALGGWLSVGSWDGTINSRLDISLKALEPDVYTKKMYFSFGSSDAFEPMGVLVLTTWDNPGHYRWKINPAADLWQIWMGETQVGAGSHHITWGGNWGGGFAAADGPAYFDEFKVYGE